MSHYDASADSPDDCPACRSLVEELNNAQMASTNRISDIIDAVDAIAKRLESYNPPECNCFDCEENTRVIREWRELIG